MAATARQAGRVSSAEATGGAGTFFEQHVDAYWLALLLVRGIPPILRDCAVVEVCLQTERLGYSTDDFLVIGDNGSGLHWKLLGQVKRSFTVSATDEECRKAVQDFWKDYKNGEKFSPVVDRFALVTLRGTNTLLDHFSGLLDCSRAARDADEFEARLATSGFLSAKTVHYCDVIRKIIGEFEGKSISAAQLWPFLRVLHILSLDLNTATRQTEAMVKTLLVHTARGQDAMGAAEATWNALLQEVAEGMPEARSFSRDDLPEAVRQRHSPVGQPEERALRALSDHSALILEGIRATIGTNLHLVRGQLVQQVIENLESAQVVLMTGAAGSGKSGVAKDVIGVLTADHFTFSFRAEEFVRAHLDETLQANQIPASANMLSAILAGQGRKVILVESVERLLEASTRDAFADLLMLVSRDKSWQVILTCRDYSADLVRACFLGSASVGHAVVSVPVLDDTELQEVEAAYPTLARPLADTNLRRLLRNPYVLDKALQIPWSKEHPLPQSEREFRAIFWREIVRADLRPAGGMPRRREEAFVQIALRRAQALTLYAPCGDLDADVVDVLRRDSLIVSSRESAVLVAPAHDVLEDWAILQWIDEQYATHHGSAGELSAVLGTHPAVRRTYRKWASELVERDPATADGLFQAVVREARLPAQFRDDTLVSLLRSPSSAAFLARHREELFADDKQLLRRVIHLLRVACVTTPTWLKPSAAHASFFNVPDGPAWACILRLVQTHPDSFTATDRSLLLAFIEDWAGGVSWQCPYPDGAASAAVIAHCLLPAFDNYRSEDQRKRTLQVIAKIPNADRDRFAALLQGSRDEVERDRVADDLREIVFEGMEGMPAARDLPGVVVPAATDYLLCSEEDLRDRWGHGSDLELETLFGIKHGRSHDFFPASAYRGPFLPLLRHHPQEGLDFVITVFNHSADWYAHPRVREEYVESPFERTLTFVDGSSKTQWCNGRLWGLYRGMSVGPYVLQCLLMALERWLLEIAEAHPSQLDGTLLSILQRSDSAALTAVVASAATASPHSAGETLLVLLHSRWCIQLDKSRLVNEARAPSKLLGLMPRLVGGNEVYEGERKQADALPHRRHDLETAIANLQMGPLTPRVHEVLDRLRATMPPPEEQNEEDRIWRLAMHRMDLRKYTTADEASEDRNVVDGAEAATAGSRRIRLDLGPLEPDIEEMTATSAVEYQVMNARLGLLNWGISVFRGEQNGTHNPAQWRQRLAEARAASGVDENELGRGGPEYVAAVSVRDHWKEMTDDERGWCVDRVCSEVERTQDNWERMERMQRNELSADRACAWVLSALLGKSLSEGQQIRVRNAFVAALTHATDEVRWYAAWGVGKNLWLIDRILTLRCVNAIAFEAQVVQDAIDEEQSRRVREGEFSEEGWVDRAEAAAAASVRQHFFDGKGIPDDALQVYDANRWFGAEATGRILAILGEAPAEPAAIETFGRAARTLVAWWDADEDRRRNRDQPGDRGRSDESELAQLQLLEQFVLRTTGPQATTIIAPIVSAIEAHPDKVHWFIQGLIGVEDRQPNTTQFWLLWKLFVDEVRCASWLASIDEEHPTGGELIFAMFLGSWWKKDVRHWRSLEGHAGHIHSLFEDLPACATVLDDYVRFLYYVGEQSLPDAFVRITRRLQSGDAQPMLCKRNTMFLLEVLLQRHVYGRPLELKSQHDLRAAVLNLLDVLVENGSSAAFRMRDDFVTPLPLPERSC
ncbi:MAG: AAA family ATPase [Phycisphaerae bacterium]|nr:AAA family ATPase [Phycisphaerae bacterium]